MKNGGPWFQSTTRAIYFPKKDTYASSHPASESLFCFYSRAPRLVLMLGLVIGTCAITAWTAVFSSAMAPLARRCFFWSAVCARDGFLWRALRIKRLGSNLYILPRFFSPPTAESFGVSAQIGSGVVRGGPEARFHEDSTRVPKGFHEGSTRFCEGCGMVRAHFRTYFSGDWDVHWGYGILAHSQMGPKKRPGTPGTRLTRDPQEDVSFFLVYCMFFQ